jgi:hypothetical protein
VTASPSGSDEPLLIEADAAEQTFGSVGTVTSRHKARGAPAARTDLKYKSILLVAEVPGGAVAEAHTE